MTGYLAMFWTFTGASVVSALVLWGKFEESTPWSDKRREEGYAKVEGRE